MRFSPRKAISFLLSFVVLQALTGRCQASAVGVNWGTTSSHPLPPTTVVSGLLRPNNVTNVKLFDADPAVLESLAGSGINVMVGIPNDMLALLNSSKKAAASWLHDNISRYLTSDGVGGGVRIEYIAVGDEPFLLSYGQQFHPFILGAATNIHLALIKAKLSDRVKVVIPCSSDVYQLNSTLPSSAHFRDDLNKTMSLLLSFLSKNHFPFVLDINPFPILQQRNNLSIDFLLFQSTPHQIVDNHLKYKNILDLSIDGLLTSLTKAGFEDMDIIIGQVGWPTDGTLNATPSIAQTFMQALVQHLKREVGTPLRPKRPLLQTYLFALLDEDQRNTSTGNYTRHFGIFTFDGQAKYNIDLGQGSKKLADARNVEYLSPKWCVANNNKDLSNVTASASTACAYADCTALSSGGSCSGIGWPANISYAFNSYYQQHDQRADSCEFGGLGLITTVDPSVGDCMFSVALRISLASSLQGLGTLLWSIILSWFVASELISLVW